MYALAECQSATPPVGPPPTTHRTQPPFRSDTAYLPLPQPYSATPATGSDRPRHAIQTALPPTTGNIKNQGTNPIRAPPCASPFFLCTPPQPQMVPDASVLAATGADLVFPRAAQPYPPAFHPTAPAKYLPSPYPPKLDTHRNVWHARMSTRTMRLAPTPALVTWHRNHGSRHRSPDCSRPVRCHSTAVVRPLVSQARHRSAPDRSRPGRYHSTAVAGPR